MKMKTSPEEKPKKRGGIQPRNRTKYTTSQLHAMESLFLVSQYPDSTTVEDLGKSLSVSIERISIWFQNRRSKFKRQSKDVHMAWMRKQIFNQGSCQNQMTSQPMAPCLSPPEKCHVLSPPEEEFKQEQTLQKPKSNLHYMPMTSLSTNELPFYSGSLTSTTPTTLNYANSSQTSPGQPPFTSSPPNPLLMSHLLNDASTTNPMVTPGYQSCNYGNSTYYNSYPYYSQMNPYYSMNQQQMYSTQQPLGV